jgi:transposase
VCCGTSDRDRVCGEGAHAHPGFDPGRVGGGGGQGIVGAMIPVPSGVRVWLAVGHTDMRRGMNSLALQVQEVLKRDPHAGDLYVFRGKRGHLVKILWHDGIGMSLYAKRLERGRFLWPSPADGIVAISAAQLAYMLDGIDWRNPVRTWRPQAAG